jgi:hypothetical protein
MIMEPSYIWGYVSFSLVLLALGFDRVYLMGSTQDPRSSNAVSLLS